MSNVDMQPCLTREAQSIHPLNHAQQGLWFAQHLNPEAKAKVFNVAEYLEIPVALNLPRFEMAVRTAVQETESLRVRLHVSSFDITQSTDVTSSWTFPVLDFRQESDPLGKAKQWMEDACNRSFDLEQGPLFSFALIQIAAEHFLFYQCYHHIVMDGYSASLFIQRVAERYAAFSTGERAPDSDFIGLAQAQKIEQDYETSPRARHDREYWLERLANRPDPVSVSGRQARCADILRRQHYLPEQTQQRLRRVAEQCKISLPELLITLVAFYLHRVTGREELLLGMPMTTRVSRALRRYPGMVSNVLPLRLSVSPATTLSAGIEQTKRAVFEVSRHQRYRYEALKADLGMAAGRETLFSTLINILPCHNESLCFEGTQAKIHNLLLGPVDDLSITLFDRGENGGIELCLNANAALYQEGTLTWHLRRLSHFFTSVAAEPGRPVGEFALLLPEELALMRRWHTTSASVFSSPHCLHELFEQQAKARPQAVAVSFEGRTLSYDALNRRANQLARELMAQGVQPDSRVAIALPRGSELIVAILAVLKAGAGYVPLDPGYPQARLQYMLKDSAPEVLLTCSRSLPSLGDLPPALPLRVLDDDAHSWTRHSEENIPVASLGLTPHHLAYIIYTSGSTGQPKGVMVEHRNVTRLLSSTQTLFDFDHHDSWTLFHSYAFDFSVWEIWGALLHGGRLVVVPQTVTRSPQALYQLVCREGVTVLNQTPGVFRQLTAAQADSDERHALRYVIFGGEALDVAALTPWYRQNPDVDTQLVNMYGITETTVHVTHCPLSAGMPAGESPIGRPLPDLRLYILDGHGEPVPLGVTGELYVGGAGVTRGYLNQPELTEARFPLDPFSGEAGARMYRTGNLGRWREDGTVEYLGRNDFQVKIRGFRIELGEIESRLAAHPQVDDAVVVAREEGDRGAQLVAYFVPAAQAGVDEPSAQTLRDFLFQTLPEYMLPAAYVRLASLPLTLNGKLDRRALPSPDADARAMRTYAAPQGPVEGALARIWEDLLDVPQVGRHDNFFELGGHSMLAVGLMRQMRAVGLNADVRVLFEQPTLASLATAVGGTHEVTAPDSAIPIGCTQITPAMLPLATLSQSEIDRIVSTVPGGAAAVQDIYPLTPLQEGLLYHSLTSARQDPYLLHILMAFDSRARRDNFIQALNLVMARHDVLRTAMCWEGLREPMQVVYRTATLPVSHVKISPQAGCPVDQLLNARPARIDIDRAPLLAAQIAEDRPNDRWLMTLLYHHLVDDATSLQLLVNEALVLLRDDAAELPTPYQFRGHVAQVRQGGNTAMEEAFFHQLLGTVTEPTLPYGLADNQQDGRETREAIVPLPAALVAALREQGKVHGVGVASLVHLAWGRVVSVLSGREDVVFGTVLIGRLQGGAEQALGMFINTLPLRLTLADCSVTEALSQTQTRLAGLLRHEHASLSLAQRCSGIPAPAPLFSALLNYRHTDLNPQDKVMTMAEGIEVLSADERTNYPLLLNVDDQASGLTLTVQSCSTVDAARVADYMQTALENLILALREDVTSPLCSVGILPADERTKIFMAGGDEASLNVSPFCLHELFEQQAKARPQAVAVSFEGRTLSYDALNRRANQLARELMAQGVQPDSRVAIALPRGSELIVAILAVLKAGAGYVPLDPGYPQARLQYMLKDSAPEVLLTCSRSLPSLGDLPPALPLRVLDDDAHSWTRHSEENIPVASLGLTPHHLAYIIYTSGSTGQPKGVMVEHRNVTRLLSSTQTLFDFDHHDSWTLFHSYAFDFSVWEIWGALLHGGRLVVVPQTVTRSPQALYQLVCREGVTVLNQTPGVFRQLTAAQADSDERHALRYVIFGGEALDVAALTPWYRQNPDVDTQLVNMYGITETTVHVTHCPLSAGMPAGESPIGRPLPDLRLYILDGRGEPVPLGVTGELYVGGAGVTRGYLNQPELTEARFPLDPFSGEAGARMYRTGDLGRWREDGTVEYLGRNDFQVKIRGFRIELGEIESALQACDGVKQAVVTAMSTKTQDKQLVAYYVAEQRGQVLATDALKAQLGQRLPAFMVPAAYVVLDSVPLTLNGKVDRSALPAPDLDAFEHQVYEAPQGDTETTLAAIWRSVLGVEQVGRHDSFFALGGHSLLAVQLISRVRSELQRELPVATLFECPVLHELAAALDIAPTGHLPDILPVAEGVHPPLSLAQQRLWFLSRMDDTARAAYLIAFTIRIEGELNVTALAQALDRIVDRHAALRTCIAERDGAPVQVIASDGSGFPLRQTTLDAPIATPDTASESASDALAHGELIAVGAQEHHLRLSFHHLVADGWSVGIFLQELQSLYTAFSQGSGDPLPPLAIQFGDYAAWQQQHMQGEELRAQQAYWEKQLSGIPDCLTLPSDRPRQPMQDYRGASLNIELEPSLTQDLKSLSQRHGATLFMILLAGWSALMSRLSGQEDVVIGSPVAGRGRQELEPLIGMFVNTLALRVNLSEQPDTVALLAQVKAMTLAAQEHPDLPFEQVVEMLAPARSLSHSPVFQVMLALQNTPEVTFTLPGLNTSLMADPVETAQFDLSLDLREADGRITGRLYYATALFDAATARRYLDYWHALLRGMTADPHQPVQTLPLLPDDERRQLLFGFNATRADYPAENALHTLFEEQAERQPNAAAVECDGERLSYGELNRRANQLAYWLMAQGVRPDGRVAIVLERSCDLIVAMLATLKAGGAYVPIDPATPTERLAYLLEDSGPQAIITERALRSRLGELSHHPHTLVIDAAARPWTRYPQDNIPLAAVGLTSFHLAYLIYTSGSTGRPKGVMVEHRNIINLVHWHCEAFALRSRDCVSSVAGLGFDAAAWEIWPALSVGARLLLPSPVISRDPDQLLAWWCAQPLDVSFLPTPIAELAFVREAAPATLRTLLVGGDRLNRQPFAGARFTLMNNYGPTENTVVATSGDISADEALLHIGRPIANTQTYILDARMQPVPVGVCGELYIGGAQVARGYLNRQDLTTERFIPDPFSSEPHARLYRTGDLGRWRANGTIEFLGRSDFQVKIRGFRIELGEIEDALLHCEGIQQAVVVAQGGAAQEKRLIAYYLAEKGTNAPSIDALREQLLARLPEYMVPMAWVPLESLPLTANGKVDRRALPEPDDSAFIRQHYEAPQGKVEPALAAIWQALLRVETVGRRDNFFLLGGHSLLAVQLISRIRSEMQRELDLKTLFMHPTLCEMAQALGEKAVPPLPAISPLAAAEPPLSLAQQRLWLLVQMDPAASAAYMITGGIRLQGNLNPAALQQALDRIVLRHAALRTHIVHRDGVDVQAIAPAESGFPLHRLDMSGSQDRPEPFTPSVSITTGPLAQGQLLRISPQEHWLRLALHHIIADGWSVGILMRELGTLYSALSQGQPDPLPPLPIQYGDYAAWQRQHLQGERMQEQQRYWVEQLRGAPDNLMLPTDRPRPPLQSFAGAYKTLTLDADLTQALKTLGQQHGCTLYMTLLAGWSALMSRLSGQDDIVIGSPIAGRDRQEIEPLIGMFVNTLALRVAVTPEMDTAALLAQVRRTTLAAQSHADIPFEQVVEAVAPVRTLSHSPIFQVMMALHNLPEMAIELPELRVSPLPNETATCQFDLNLELRETNGLLEGTLYYATALFDEDTAQRYLDYWQRLLRGMVASAAQPVATLPLVSADERQRVLTAFNATESAYPADRCLHELFEIQAHRQPTATALVSGERRLSYGELNERANQLAHWLMAEGVRPDDRVAICVTRGPDMVVALLGILKAGGAYVPLDPLYPTERLAHMIADCTPLAVLCDDVGRSSLASCSALPPILDLSADEPLWAKSERSDPDPQRIGLTPRHLAYTIYTSGSTGRPKGVAMPHAPLVNLVHWQNQRPAGVTLQFASFGFDVASQEILSALTGGGRLIIVPDDVRLDMPRLADLLEQQHVERAFIPPSVLPALAQMYRASGRVPPSMEIIASGEALRLGPDVRALFQHSEHVRLHNQYGPAETHVASEFVCPATFSNGVSQPPIGRPIANSRLYILDEKGEPVPVGVAGEIYIGGVGVARGYLNQPALTAERFIRDPFSSEADARMYKTGDRGRWRKDGILDYLGRNDDQVKIRGFRIEPGEVEACLSGCPDVEAAVVVPRECGGEKRLVAYYRGSAKIEAMRTHLVAQLPAYMVPAAWVALTEFPLSPNGKVNRHALPEPGDDAFAHAAFEAPQDETEQAVAAIWLSLLGVERIGRHDNFFELGGHSLLAVQLVSRLRLELDVDVPLGEIFAHPSLSALSERILDLSIEEFDIAELLDMAASMEGEE
ncbi:amino acid adenylation domain-containing protein [Lonsdalea quercina]|uniref:amino acid adenylation domain-containing protein n=1 Tax=Lonsdalea quercina TaxID=71657 RepID=UPI003F45F01F